MEEKKAWAWWEMILEDIALLVMGLAKFNRRKFASYIKSMEYDKVQFVKDIYAITRLIPKGRVTSYGAIATALEQKRRVRMVGYAMNKSPQDVPAHRVVNRNGILTGRQFFGGTRMQELLQSEGVEVDENKVVNFKKVFWNPIEDMDC